jgi:thiol:disulfide interchange protein DsbG
MNASVALPNARRAPWGRRSAWATVAVLASFLALRGVVSIWQQLAAVPGEPAAEVAPAQVSLLTREQRRARAQTLVTRIGEGAQVLEVFVSPTGLTGVVLDTGNGGRVVAWMPDTHETLFIGAAFDRTGLNISQQEMLGRGFATAERVPPATSPAAQAAASTARTAVSLRSFEKSAGFVEGSAGPLITAFIDLNCGYCSRLWRQLRAPLAGGQLRVRWVPVAVLAPDSAGKAAALLQQSDPIQALAAHASRDAPLPVARASAAVADGIAANNALLELVTAGRPATPVLVARGADEQPYVAIGLPPDLAAFLREAR